MSTRKKRAAETRAQKRVNEKLPRECPEPIREALVKLDPLLEQQGSELIDEQGHNWGSRMFCTTTARFVAYHLEAEVAGFYFDRNQRATLGREFNRGHDFCLTTHYVIDYWGGFLHALPSDLPEHPTVLHRKNDDELIETFYGHEKDWTIRTPESFTNTPEQAHQA